MRKKNNDELWRLQQELLAVEEDDYKEEEELDILDQFLEEEDPEALEEFFETDYEEEYGQEPFYRNHANNYGEDVKNFANRYGKGSPKKFEDNLDFEDEIEDDSQVLYHEDYRKAKKKKKKANFGLMVLAIAEIAAIGAILYWWASWVL